MSAVGMLEGIEDQSLFWFVRGGGRAYSFVAEGPVWSNWLALMDGDLFCNRSSHSPPAYERPNGAAQSWPACLALREIVTRNWQTLACGVIGGRVDCAGETTPHPLAVFSLAQVRGSVPFPTAYLRKPFMARPVEH